MAVIKDTTPWVDADGRKAQPHATTVDATVDARVDATVDATVDEGALPWYRSGGMHVTEVGHAVTMIAVQYVLTRDLLGSSFLLKLSYFAGLAMCMLAGQRPRGGVTPGRWVFATLVMPTYFGSLLLLPTLHRPLVCPALALTVAIAKIGVCMSVCLHRYTAHRAFRCHQVTSLAIQLIGCLANQGGPLWWAANHRCHHKHCDEEDEALHALDPHSPQLDGQANAFASLSEHKHIKEEHVPKHCDSVAARLIDTFAIVPPVVEMMAVHAACGADGLWISFVSGWVSQCMALWFNVVNHLPEPGDPTAVYSLNMNGKPSVCKAMDNAKEPTHLAAPNVFFRALNQFLWIGALVGEDTHGHHHTYANLAYRPGLDLPYHVFVRPLAALGLIWDVKIAGRERVKSPKADSLSLGDVRGWLFRGLIPHASALAEDDKKRL